MSRTDTAADPGVIMFLARPSSRAFVKADVLGDPVLSSTDGYTVDMSGLIAAPTTGTITFSMSQTNLTPLNTYVGFESAAGCTLSTGASVSYQSYLDANDGPFGKGTLLASCSMTGVSGQSWLQL